MFQPLNIAIAHIHQGLLSWVPPAYIELGDILENWFQRHPLPEIALPLCAGLAAGGNPEDPRLMRSAAAMLAGIVGIHILDELREKNSPQALWIKVGAERAAHYASAFQALSGQLWARVLKDGDASEAAFQYAQQGNLIALAGRDRALREVRPDWGAYWETAEMTDGWYWGNIAAAGAVLGGGETGFAESCRDFGRHFGLAHHILKAYMAFEQPDNPLRYNALPLLYGLQAEHPDRTELKSLVDQDQAQLHQERLRKILDQIDAKGYLMWAALEERKKAAAAISQSPNPEGQVIAEAFLNAWFEQIPGFRQSEADLEPAIRQVPLPQRDLDLQQFSAGLPDLTYRSAGLGLRQRLRQTTLSI